MLSVDLRAQFDKSIATIRGIVESFPDDKWLSPHGDDYYIPCRMAYHLVVVVDRIVCGGFKDPEFNSKLPYGLWQEATPEILPDKPTFMAYFDEVISKAQDAMEDLDDEFLLSSIDPERSWMGEAQIGAYIYLMRELSAHTGELNKMLIENGEPDIWISR